MFFSLSPFSLPKRKNQLFLTASCSLFIALSSSIATAQVNVNHSALNSLGDGHKKPNKETHKERKKSEHTTKKKQSYKTTATTTTKPVTGKKPAAVLPTIPTAAPAAPVFKDPEIIIPLHPPVPPPMPTVVKDAKGEVRVTDKHTLVIFDTDSIDLNESMMKKVMDFANILKQHPDTTVYLNAYSHGNADDLSTPRRIALNRGLTIRAVLINQGIPPTRIYLLAKGFPEKQTKDLSPDHVEMIRSDLMEKVKSTSPQNK